MRLQRGSGGAAFLTIVAGTLGIQVMLLVTGILAARLLGVEGRGQVALVAAASALVVRLTLGASVPLAVTQLLAREQWHARDALRPLVGRWLWQSSALGLLVAAYVAWTLSSEDPLLRWGLAVGAGLVTVQAIAGALLGGAMQGELASAPRLVAGGLALQAPFFVLLVAVFVAGVEVDAAGVVGLQVVAAVPALLVCWWLLKPATGRAERLDRREVGRTARGSYVTAIGSINGIGLDRNLVGALLGTAALGLYATALALANLCTVIGTGITTILLPRLSALVDDHAGARALRRRWMPATALLMLLVVGFLQLVAEPVIRLAFGEEFTPAVEVARWLVLADGLLGYRKVQSSVLVAQGRGGLASRIELCLTVAVALAIVAATLASSLVLVGVAMAGAGLLSVVALQVAIVQGDRRAARAAAA